MFSWLKKHFIPHEGNEHRPHILREHMVRRIVGLVIILEIFCFLIPTLARINMSGGLAAVLPAVLADLTNQERKAENLPALAVSPILNKAAEMKANDMATKGYFAHTSPEGKTPWFWLEQVGYKYQYAGENLAINFSDSKDVTEAWMASPTHKANIDKGNYTEIGTGIASGLYKGRETIFVAQVYANPLPRMLQQKIVPAKPATKNTSVSLNTKKVFDPFEIGNTNILGAETVAGLADAENIVPEKTIPAPTFWQKLLASPHSATDTIMYVIFGLIVLALLLYLFIKMRDHHQDLITNGLVALAVVGAFMVMNFYLSHSDMIVTQSLDYSIENQ